MSESPKSRAAAPHTQTENRHVARSALLVAALFAVDKLLGVVREAAVGHAFGASAALDAYIAAFEIPEGLNTIVTGAALTTSLIPLLTTLVARDDSEDKWRFISAVINWVLLLIGSAGVAAALFARPIILLVAPGFSRDPAQVMLAVQLMRLVLIQTIIFSVSTLITGTLQAHRHFLLPAISPLFYTLGRLLGAVLLAPRMGIFGLAWGGMLGALFHLLVKLPWLIRHRARWFAIMTHGELASLLRLMLPRMMGMGATYINFVLPTTFGSHLPAGAISAYEYGWKLMQLPETVVGTAMGIVVLPTLAAIAARGDYDALRRTFGWSLRLILALTIPAGAGLLLLGHPLTVLLLQRGAFDPAATERVTWALQFFALGLVGHAALEVVARLFYAQKDMWAPFWAALAGLAANATIGWLLLPTLAHGGIALSNSLGACLQVGILLAVSHARLDGIDGRELISSVTRTLAATVAMAAVVLSIPAIAPSLAMFPTLLVQLAAGALTYLTAALVFGSKEIRSLPALIAGRDR